ncbi:MAG: hypothetical protein AAFV19_14355 [Pseudomonadota bacterium]
MHIAVHIWLPTKKRVGHASLSLIATKGFTLDYLSFWPHSLEKGAKVTDIVTRKHKLSDFMPSLADDRASEKGRDDWNIPIPVDNFDVMALSKFIDDIKSRHPKYHLTKYNCSSVVAEALHEASGIKPSFKPTASGYGRLAKMFGRGIWTPVSLKKYAEELSRPRADAV